MMRKNIFILGLWGLFLKACATDPLKTIAQNLKEKCNANDYTACNDLGYLYEYGLSLSVDKKAAFGLYTKSCEGNNPAGCNNLGRFYAFGTKNLVKVDLEKSIELFDKACKMGEKSACSNLNLLNVQHAITKKP